MMGKKICFLSIHHESQYNFQFLVQLLYIGKCIMAWTSFYTFNPAKFNSSVAVNLV